jgi:hypothetical protein
LHPPHIGGGLGGGGCFFASFFAPKKVRKTLLLLFKRNLPKGPGPRGRKKASLEEERGLRGGKAPKRAWPQRGI